MIFIGGGALAGSSHRPLAGLPELDSRWMAAHRLAASGSAEEFDRLTDWVQPEASMEILAEEAARPTERPGQFASDRSTAALAIAPRQPLTQAEAMTSPIRRRWTC